MSSPETEIVITNDGVEIAHRTFKPGTYIIGRDSECGIMIEVDGVSRKHAKLTINSDHALIEDLGSSNGTYVNDKPITKAVRLWSNQQIRIGSSAKISLRRLKTESNSNQSLASAVVKRILPENKYDIGGVVAQGGMGAILNAKEATIERTVAMKVMLDTSSSEDIARFISEAKITGQLEHPNIVPVHDLSVDENDQVFYTMKFVSGVTLRDVIQQLSAGDKTAVAKYTLPYLITVFQKVCDAMAFAHSKQVIHRDLKPDNIMIGDFGEVLVMDWGLAKVLGQPESVVSPEAKSSMVNAINDSVAASVTMAGAVMGTPQFMAPEQARGEIDQLDARSDIYALGAILYNILALRPPIEGKVAWDIVRRVGEGEIKPLTAPKSKAGNPQSKIPESLAAVVHKAMALHKSARYQTVPDLQRDIEAYQTGFATSAEKAGAWKQFTLFVKRNKTLTSATLIILILTIGFMIKVIASERRALTNEKLAVESLNKLRSTAPTFAAQSAALVEKREFADALEKIEFAIALAPDETEYWVSKGHILESLSRLADALEAYQQALARKPTHTFAKENVEFCEAALKLENTPGQLTSATRNKLQNLMRRQGRVAEAIALLGVLGKDKKAIYDTWRAALNRAGIKQHLDQNEDGFLGLDLTNSGIDNLEVLRGMPLDYLNIAGTKVSDLSPLAGMPLKNLNLVGCSQIRDLAPLKGMPLRLLQMDNVQASDLGPLSGMPLKTLWMRGTKVTDLSPLHGLPLRELVISGSPVSNLTPLQGMSLTYFRASVTPVSDLTPLKGMPLEFLELESTRVTNLSPLAGMPLKNLILHLSPVTDLGPLAGLPLVQLNIDDTKIRDLAPLRGMKIERLAANQTPVSDLAPLEGMPLTNLGLRSTAVRDLSPLKSSKIKILDIRDTPISDISPLRNQPIESLLCFADRIPDLTPLQTMPLKRLLALNAKLNDLTFLKKLPLDELVLEGSTIVDIRGLAGMPLRILVLTKTSVRDLKPLANCRKLEQLAIPAECKNIDFLRSLPSLQRLDTKWSTATGVVKTAAVFWKEYDEKKGSVPK